jgi:membrane protease YdiL (CAAX protease family)
VATDCARCDQPWRIHADLSGYRLRCVCGGWVRVPYPTAVVLSARAAAERSGSAPAAPGAPSRPRHTTGGAWAEGAEVAAVAGTRAASPPERPSRDRSSDPTRPAPGDPLPHREARRAIDRTIIELALLAFALIAPPTAAFLAFGADGLVRWLPVTSLAGGVLVLVIALASGAFGLDGLRGARPRHFIESILGAAGAVAIAVGLLALLERSVTGADDFLGTLVGTLGVPIALFVVALCPAVFEEIAFRGVVQGRLIALLGTRSGVIVAAMAFALAHGLGVVTPLHFLLGAYLGSLRLRSGSLIPGMLFHALYNGTLVLLAQPA